MAHYLVSSLDEGAKRRLDEVSVHANGNLDQIRDAVVKVLRDVQGKPAYGYLFRALSSIAADRIRAKQRRVQQIRKTLDEPKKLSSKMEFEITPALVLDAWRHEQSLMRNIPEDDR